MEIDPRVDIGHVHLKVSDLDRAIAFYRDVLGFELMHRYGDQAAFLSAGGYHHHIGLNTWESLGGSPPPRGTTGLYHVAIRYPDRQTLAQAVKEVVDQGIPLSGASDHGVSEAIYLHDPDQNGIELYRDRPRDEAGARRGLAAVLPECAVHRHRLRPSRADRRCPVLVRRRDRVGVRVDGRAARVRVAVPDADGGAAVARGRPRLGVRGGGAGARLARHLSRAVPALEQL